MEEVTQMLERLRGLVLEENGPTAIEYALIAALVAVVIIAALIFLGNAITNLFGYVGNQVNQ